MMIKRFIGISSLSSFHADFARNGPYISLLNWDLEILTDKSGTRKRNEHVVTTRLGSSKIYLRNAGPRPAYANKRRKFGHRGQAENRERA